LTCVQVSLDYYRRESAKIIAIFKECSPDGEIGELGHVAHHELIILLIHTHHESEKASIDEAFIDFTHPVRAELLARYPYLGQVPADAPKGLDTVLPPPPPIFWENRGILIPIDPPSENQASSSSSHGTGTHAGAEDGDDDARRTSTWHDVALSIAAEFMDKIRAQVRIQLGYTTSAVGISLRFGCYDTTDGSPLLMPVQRYRELLEISFWPRCASRQLIMLAPFVHVTRRTAHRVVQKAGLAGLSRSDPLHIVGLMFSQSILRNAAIPNYLMPMPFQKVTRV